MKIKNQFRISIVAFLVIVVIIAASIIVTQQLTAQLINQESIVGNIETGASNLNYISNNYFLYQDNASIVLWQSQHSKMINYSSSIVNADPQQKAMIQAIKSDLDNLKIVFDGVVLFLEGAPRGLSVRSLPEFQTQWSRMIVQIQALSFDSKQLSTALNDRANQLSFMSTILIVALLGLFGAYFITNYFLQSRNTLKSISKLQEGISIIGSGDLNYSVKAGKRDEIEEISKSVNLMAANLRAVTASKSDLELEIAERKRAEEALRESEQLYRTLFDNSEDGFMLLEPLYNKEGNAIDFRFLKINDAFERQTGAKAADVLGKKASEVVPEIEPEVVSLTGKVAKTGKSTHSETFDKYSNKWYDSQYIPFARGQVGILFRDITERKKAEEALKVSLDKEHFLAELVRNASVAIGVGYPDGRLGMVNEAFQELTGYSEQELQKITWNAVLTPPEYKEFEKTKLAEINRTKKPIQYEKEYIRKNGSRVSIELTVHPFFDDKGNVTHYFSFINDIAERKTFEKLLRDNERMAAIGATAGMVGHDIRNPLQAIISELYLAKEVLMKAPEGKDKQESLESVNFIEEQVNYINKIVSDLQDYARPLNPEYSIVNLPDLIVGVFDTIVFPDKIKLKVDIESKLKLKTDPTFIKRAVANLVNNAIQAMPDGGELGLTAHEQEGCVVISVSDTGRGIPEHVKANLFKPLTTTKAKGQGLGLAVVKRLVEGLNGKVSFESEEGKGTKFTIKLPQMP